MIAEILATQGQAVEALGEQLLRRVIDEDLRALVVEALGQRAGQAQVGVDLAQEQHSAIAGEGAAAKIGHESARTQVGKQEGFLFGRGFPFWG